MYNTCYMFVWEKKYIVIVIGIFLCLLSILFLIPFKKNISPLSPVVQIPQRKVYIGLWTDGFFNNTTHAIDPTKLQSVESEIGKNVAIANYYRGWEFLAQPTIVTELNTISANGWRPMVSANPYFFANCPANGLTLYKAIAAGNCDAFLEQVGKTLKQVKKPFFLRFAWEMNVLSMPWSTQYSKDSPQDFIVAWNHFHDIVKKAGAKNVIWVFSPQVDTGTTTPIAQLYPGDMSVDWVGLDGYNWGTTQSWSHWQSFSTIFTPSYNTLTTIAPTKPLMIAEINSASAGGDKAAWYTDMLTQQIPHNFPKIAAIVFFNEDKFATEGVKWLIDETPPSLAAFKNGMQNSLYVSQFSDTTQ